jgi:predicted ATP-dependent endonuclease of OLD family
MAEIQIFTLKNFKGADHVSIDISKRIESPVVTLIGLNESGKTTILEGLSYFITGDNAVSSLFDGVHSKLDATSLIPIHRKAAFTGIVSVSADITLDEEDFQSASELAKKHKLVIDKNSFPEKLQLRREYTFEDSVLRNSENIYELKLNVYPLSGITKRVKAHERPTSDGPSLSKEVYVQLVEKLPRIAYFPTFLVDMPARIYLKEHKGERPVNRYYREVFQDILDSLNEGLTLERHVCKRIEDFVEKEESTNWFSAFQIGPSKITIDLVFQKISSVVTKEVLGSWRNIFQLPISAKSVLIEWQIDTEKENIPYASFYVSDGESRYAISERSLGFRWFFSFLLFTGFKKASNRPTLFVFDEPAANLHAKAQAELLKSFSKIVTGGNRVVYSTHSHHMINPRWLSGAYIVENEALDYDSDDAFGLTAKPTKIKATNYREFVAQYSSRSSYFQPVIEKLEYITPEILGSAPFLIIEGISDYYAMKLVKDGDPTFAHFSLMPGTGSGALGPLISLLMGRGERFFVLLDDDKSGKDAAKKYREEWYLSTEIVQTLGELDSKFNKKCLEGLICSETIHSIKEHMQLNTSPSKKQIGLYFAEQCMTSNDVSRLGQGTRENLHSVLTSVGVKLKTL